MINMAQFDYVCTRATGDRLVKKFGMKAALRRGGIDRDCYVVMPEYLSSEKPSEMTNPTDRQVYIAAGLGAVPTTPPDNEVDQLVTYVQPLGTPPVVDEILPFTAASVKPIRPAGIVVLWQATVRR
jgi:hypothetical protein